MRFIILLFISSLAYGQDSIVFNLGSSAVTIYKDGHEKRIPSINQASNGKVLSNDGSAFTWINAGGGGYDGDPTTINQDATHRFVSDTEKSTWNGKQDALGFTPAANNHNHDGVYSPVLVSGTNIKTVNNNSLLGSGNISVYGLADDPDFLAYQALGSSLKSQTVGQPLQTANTSSNLTDGQIRWVATYLPTAQTITGIRVYTRVLGSYTGDNNNRVGLYSYSGGTLTLVASSSNLSTLWTNAANSFHTIAFSGTYSASAGIYFVAILYNNSAQTTAPAVAVGTALNNAAMANLGFTNSAKLYGTSNATDLPASIAMSSITASTAITWVSLY